MHWSKIILQNPHLTMTMMIIQILIILIELEKVQTLKTMSENKKKIYESLILMISQDIDCFDNVLC